MTKVLTIFDRQEWTNYIRGAAEYDFYHTWHYHNLENSLENNSRPLLFVYQKDDDYIVFPLLERKIPETEFFDLTCVYGFSGPVSNKKMESLEDSFIESFKDAFISFLVDGNYISIFIRMHPFYKQQTLLNKFGGVHSNGKTVVIDLLKSIDDQRKDYRQSTMDSIKHAWKKGYRVAEEKGADALAIFTNIYNESMKRVGAADSYLFNDQYFASICNTNEYDARVLMVYDGDTIMSSTIITFTNDIIQAHLVGTRAEYLHKSPTKFLVDEITLIGRREGMRYYNLGGGLGYKHDNLFEWKSAFSNLHFEFNTWRYIANPAIYQNLVAKKGIINNAEIDFFPLYRYS
jgi:hypothetical protein